MLVIRNAQLEAFRQAGWRSFLVQVEVDVRAALVARGDPRAIGPLGAEVERAVAQAKRHGFRTRPHLARFARCMVVAGARWESPAADETADEETRLARLEASAGV